MHCFKQGHDESDCHVLHPELWIPQGEGQHQVAQVKRRNFRPKESRKGEKVGTSRIFNEAIELQKLPETPSLVHDIGAVEGRQVADMLILLTQGPPFIDG